MSRPRILITRRQLVFHVFTNHPKIRKHFSQPVKEKNYIETLNILADAKPTTDDFFDNVIVNDKDLDIKKNRLELLQMFCKTYNNFIDFSKIEGA